MSGAGGRRALVSVLVAIGVGCSVSLVGAELVLRAVHANRKELEGSWLGRLNRYMVPPLSWQRRFLERHAKGKPIHEGLHRPHAKRGWALKPNLSETRDGVTYTTNDLGWRSRREFVDEPGRFQVIALGDSFTFGDGVDDDETWPHLLEQRDPRLRVYNMAGTGYGIDQMYLSLLEAPVGLRPDLVILAYTANDLRRSLLEFRDYKKPRFVIRNGELALTNLPIGEIEEVVAELRDTPPDTHSRSQVVNVLNSLLGRSESFAGPRFDAGEGSALNQMLIDSVAAVAEERDAGFLLLYLPVTREITDPAHRSYGEDFFDRYRSERQGHFLNPRAALLRAGFEKAPGHYRAAENGLVSALVFERIRELPAWKRFASEPWAPRDEAPTGRPH